MEKMKQLWVKFVSNKKLFWGVIGGAAALLVILGVVIALCAGGGSMDGCTVTVKTEGGMAMEGVGVYVYADANKKEMVSFVKTDAQGVAAITDKVPTGSIAVLDGVPAGFVAQESYPITEENTQIVLSIELLKEMAPITLGGVMFDFTVTDTDGVSYTLSELLKEKDAVVLNLWFAGCLPCKAEFPFLQEAYDKYSENIALLALNPVAEDDEEAVKAFKAENGLTFPMAKCDAQWEQLIEGIAYPTTIIIDRYGMVSLIHVGSIDNAKTFEDAFAFFTAEDYIQTKVENIEDLKTEAVPSGEGTEETPLEFGGVTEFEVTVKPGEKVYCDIYKVSGMHMQIADAAATVTYNGTEYAPVEGVIDIDVVSEDTFTPVKLAIGNTGEEEKTFKVVFTFLPGTMGNPIPLENGDLNVKIEAGNNQGVYYLYKATENGTLTLECTNAPENTKYDFTLYNLNSYKMATYGENGFLAEDTDNPSLTIEVSANDEVQMIVSTLPDENNEYPAADFTFNAIFEKNAGSTGDSTGGSAGDSTGGSTGDSTGGSAGGSTGGSTGGNTGGSTGGSSTGKSMELYVGTAYYVVEGSNSVTASSSDISYFVFEPTRSGKYSISIDSGSLTYYGNNTAFIQDLTHTVNCNGKSFSLNITEDHLGGTYIIGVEGVSSTKITVTRTGAAAADSSEISWKTYTAKQTPSKFTYSGGSLTMVDITGATTQVVKGSDGYYHWGSAAGPVVYVDLDDGTYLNSFKSWLESDRPIIKAGDSKTNTGWDFTECMKKYVNNRDSSTGVYPMTEDLYFMLDYLYEHSAWELNLLDALGTSKKLNKDMGWLFCCCYEA